MEVVIVDTPEQAAILAADAVVRLFRQPGSVLGVATGSSPLGIYAELGRRVAAGEVTLAGATVFMLDEYVGLPEDHPQRYRNVVQRDFVDKVDVAAANVHGPDGLAEDLDAACVAYDRAIADAGGIDLQILGLGTDGHLAFNEPGSSLASRTRIKTLTHQTRSDNARFFENDLDQVPRHCLTQGLGTIMECRHALVVATGTAKAQAVHEVVEGPVSARWPGSVLQLHPHATLLVDRPASSRLQLAGYYEETWANKPDWQGI